MRTLKTKKFYKELAKKYNVTAEDISIIDNAQFELVRQVIGKVDKESEYFPSIRLPYFGMFRIPYKVRENIISKLKRDKDESISDEELQTGD